jgi:hypothetical protein
MNFLHVIFSYREENGMFTALTAPADDGVSEWCGEAMANIYRNSTTDLLHHSHLLL